MLRHIYLLFFSVLLALTFVCDSAGAQNQPKAVNLINHSFATKCAEEDNIYYTLQSPAVRKFRVEARAVAYLDQVTSEAALPDFSGCSFGHDGESGNPPPPPRDVRLYEDDEYVLQGVVYQDFWRPGIVPLTVAGKSAEIEPQLVQLYKKTPTGLRQFLVFYPQDGYWRMKPLPPPHLPDVNYGSSFLIGPIVAAKRPYVEYTSVGFDPQTLTITAELAKGGKVKVHVAELRAGMAAVEVAFEGVTAAAEGFAGLRSMYVEAENADSAEIQWKSAADDEWHSDRITEFKSGFATEAVFARSLYSHHNSTAPDMALTSFELDPQ